MKGVQAVVSWDYYYINLTNHIRIKSPNPYYKVGSLLVSSDKKIKSTGYNDLPDGINNDIDWSNHILVASVVLDAEINCILYSDSDTDFADCTMYISRSPKPHNIKIIAAAGVRKICYDECCKDIKYTEDLCRYFMIELKKYCPRDVLMIGSSS